MKRVSDPRRTAGALVVVWICLSGAAFAAPVLRSAEVTVTVPSPAACEVSMRLQVDGGTTIDHRIDAPAGTDISALAVDGARQSGEPQLVGRTRSLPLAIGPAPYRISYRVQQNAAHPHRCPLWLPVAPADGVSRPVRLTVNLPAGTSAGSTMPRFTWNGGVGTATLGHLPAFVLVPYVGQGESAGSDITAAMDRSAVVVFVGASAIWLWRKRRGTGR